MSVWRYASPASNKVVTYMICISYCIVDQIEITIFVIIVTIWWFGRIVQPYFLTFSSVPSLALVPGWWGCFPLQPRLLFLKAVCVTPVCSPRASCGEMACSSLARSWIKAIQLNLLTKSQKHIDWLNAADAFQWFPSYRWSYAETIGPEFLWSPKNHDDWLIIYI